MPSKRHLHVVISYQIIVIKSLDGHNLLWKDSQANEGPEIVFFYVCLKKSLKIPKGQSESVYRRRTDNTMAKRKTNDLHIIDIKLNIE